MRGVTWARKKLQHTLTGLLLSTAMMAFAMTANAQPTRQEFSNGDAAVHRKVLKERIDQLLRPQTAAEVIGAVDVVLGTTLTLLVVPENFTNERAASLSYLVGFGAIDAAAVGSLFLTRDARSRIFQVIIPTAPAVVTLGFAVAHDPHPFPRLTAGSLTAGYFATAALEGINDFSTPTPFSRLRTHQKRLESGQELSADERRTMHHDVLGARGPLPRWLIGAPMLIAGAVAVAPAFNERYSKDEKTFAGLFGGTSLAAGLLYLFPSPVSRYEDDLDTLDISVALAPGGINARGTFNAL